MLSIRGQPCSQNDPVWMLLKKNCLLESLPWWETEDIIPDPPALSSPSHMGLVLPIDWG